MYAIRSYYASRIPVRASTPFLTAASIKANSVQQIRSACRCQILLVRSTRRSSSRVNHGQMMPHSLQHATSWLRCLLTTLKNIRVKRVNSISLQRDRRSAPDILHVRFRGCHLLGGSPFFMPFFSWQPRDTTIEFLQKRREQWGQYRGVRPLLRKPT